MQLDIMRQHIDGLRAFIDQQHYWLRQATDKLYEMEEHYFDLKDLEYNRKYKLGSIQFLKDAATENLGCPPRHFSSHCAQDFTGADGFYQSEFDLKKIV